MIINADDIEREALDNGKIATKNLPFELQAFLSDNFLAIYTKESELTKTVCPDKSHANYLIFGVIESFAHIRDIFYQEGIR